MEKLVYWQAVRTILISSVVLVFIIPVNTSGSTKISSEEVSSVEDNLYFNGTSEDVSRRKRNTLFPSPTGHGNTNLEGGYFSCMLLFRIQISDTKVLFCSHYCLVSKYAVLLQV